MAYKTRSPFVDPNIKIRVVPIDKLKPRNGAHQVFFRSSPIRGVFAGNFVRIADKHLDPNPWKLKQLLVHDEVIFVRGPETELDGQKRADLEFHLPLIFDLIEKRLLGASTLVFPADSELKEAAEAEREIRGTPLELKLFQKLIKNLADLGRTVEAAHLFCQPHILALGLFGAAEVDVPTSLGIYVSEIHHIRIELRSWIREAIDNLASQDTALRAIVAKGRQHTVEVISSLKETLEG